MRTRSAALIVAVLLATLATPALGATRQTSSPSFRAGLLVRPYRTTGTALTRALDVAKAQGVMTITAPVRWSDVAGDTSHTAANWAPLDALSQGAANRGMRVSIQLMGTPAWVHPAIAALGGDTSWYPPTTSSEVAQWSSFVSSVVTRYGTKLTAYQIWNEENDAQFWRPAPSPTAYATLLRASYLAVKKANRSAVVEFGGLAGSDATFVNAYYAAARSFSDAPANRWFFDRMNVHPYTADRLPDATDPGHADFASIDLVRRAMVAAGDTGKRLRLGEYGASTTTTWMPAVTEQQRSLMLKRSLSMAAAMGDVDELDWYAYLPNGEDGPEWAIVDAGGTPSPTMIALHQWLTSSTTAAATVPAAASGVVTVTSAVAGQAVAGTDVYVDGRRAASGSGASAAWDTRAIPNGTHAVLVVARTADGSVWPAAPTSVSVTNPPAAVASATLGRVPSTVAAGAPLTVTASVFGSTVGFVPAVVVAVRDAAGGAHDMPYQANVLVTPLGTPLAFTGSLPAPGAYTLWLAAWDGASWSTLTPPTTVTAT